MRPHRSPARRYARRVKPWVWFLNAAARTLRGAVPTLARPDDVWAQGWLSLPEHRLYLTMDPRDRHHAVTVARTLLRARADAPSELVRAALLHDVGKASRPFRVQERVAAHLIRSVPPPPVPRLGGWRGARQLAAHHARYGAEAIREAGGSPRVAELVERHEEPGGDSEAALLWEVDRRT